MPQKISISNMPIVKIADVIGLFWRSMLRYRLQTCLLFAAILIASGFNVLMPWLQKQLVDAMVANPVWDALVQLLVTLVVLRLAGGLIWRASGFLAARVVSRVQGDLEQRAFQYLIGHSSHFFSDQFTGGLVRKVKGLSGAYNQLMEQLLWALLPFLISLCGILIVLFARLPVVGACILGWFVLSVLFQYLCSKPKVRLDIQKAEKDSEVTGVLSDAITNEMNVMLFQGRSFEYSRYVQVSNERNELQKRSWYWGEWGFVVQNVLTAATELLVMGYVLVQWRAGIMTIGDLILVQSYLLELFYYIFGLNMVIRGIYEAFADAKEMVEILKTPHEIVDVKHATVLNISQSQIEFQDVLFRYHGKRQVLNHFDLTVRPKEKIALVGSSGAGKSTVIKLLLRFYDVTKGKILIDGQNISKVTQESLHESCALVPQEPVLFHRTLMENIRYGRRDATDEEVAEAAKLAHCHEFISGLSKGYETFVGERGVKLSGGERQRIAIARAILKNAPILVLDEATSSLDSESESLIQDALRTLMKNKTVIVIAHRLSTIMEMDRIIVMEQGRVVDEGTHDELLQKVGIYQKLWNIQAGGFASE